MRSLLAPLSLLVVCACAVPPTQHRAGVLDYLYPEGKAAAPPQDVQLNLPLRVGIAFTPETGAVARTSVLDESQRHALLERIAGAFTGVEGLQRIEVVPTSYLTSGGGFENVDQLRSLFGIDLIALLSYEQTQFGELNKASLSYWTIVGGYFVKGNQNETHTFVDTSVFDINSRALLFNAAGRSKVDNSSTALEAAEALRDDSTEGFEQAVDAMIAQLHTALAAFREQAKRGTVRGAGTPALQVSPGESSASGGGVGAGAVGPLELAAALALAGACILGRRGA